MDGKIRVLSDKARNHFLSGRFEDGYRCISEACDLAEQLYGKEHPYYAAILGNFGLFLHETKRGEEALYYCEQAKEIFEKTAQAPSKDYLLCLNNLATIYASLGLNDKALAVYESVLPRIERDGGLDYATILANIGSQYRRQQRYMEALDYLKPARNIYLEKGEVHNSEYYGILNLIGLCDIGLRNYKSAIYWFSKALDLLQENGRGNGLLFLTTLNNLALAYQQSGQSDTAVEIYSYMQGVMRPTLGEDHPGIVNVLDNLSEIFVQRNDFVKATTLIVDASKVNDQSINRFVGFVPVTEANNFINKFRYHIDILFSLLYAWSKPPQQCIDMAFNLIFNRKAFVLDSEIRRQNLLRTEADERAKDDFERLKAIKAEIARMKYIPLEQIADETDYFNTLRQLEDESNKLERNISYNLSGLGRHDTKVVEGSISVRKQLPVDAAVVEFVRYTHLDLKLKSAHPPRYAVFVGVCDENIQLFDLGPAQDIDDLILDVISSIKSEQSDTSLEGQSPEFDALNQKLDDLGQRLFANVLPKIDRRRHLFIVPDGRLNLLPFGILRDKDRYLIEQYTITYLTSLRDLSGRDPIEPHNQSPPVIIADPDYNFSESDICSNLSSQTSGPRHLCESFVPFLALEGTRAEGTKIRRTIGGELWLGRDALKARLMELKSPKILHIATHGFFQTDYRDKSESWDSLVRSGLVLAGVNSFLSGRPLPAEAGNGIVTAYEVSGLNLSSTDLVVLSACETGIGDIIFCEGVYGFRRAFAIAGARTLVMSLWPIPDDQTEDLMVTFYSLLKSGKEKSEAMREAQLEIKSKHPHPYYWGAFILQGDTNSLCW